MNSSSNAAQLKYLLIYPPNLLLPSSAKKAILPMGIAYLAAELRAATIPVDVLDCVIEGIETNFIFNETEYYGLTLQAIKERIAQKPYDIVGVCCQFSNLVEISIEICRIANEECNIPHTIVGGTHASASPETLLDSNVINYVFIGESEKTLLEFTRHLSQGNISDMHQLDGIAYKENNHVTISPKTAFIENLDEIHLPARDLFPMEKYFAVSSPMGGVFKSRRNTSVLTSRGCPGRCNYCTSTKLWGAKFRQRSAENVLDELAELKDKFGVEEVRFSDDNFTLNKKRALQICRGMQERQLGLHWAAPQGIALWAIDNDIIDAMSESGCYTATLAIESGNQRVLKEVMQKPLKLDKVPGLCDHFRKRGIKISAFFIVGFPDETLAEIRDTFKFATKCNLSLANFSYATPLPGTRLWEQAEKESLFIEGFSLKNIRYDKPSLTSKNWKVTEMLKVVQSCKRKLYLKIFLKHPTVILSRIIEMLRVDPKRLLSLIYNQLFSSLFPNKKSSQ